MEFGLVTLVSVLVITQILVGIYFLPVVTQIEIVAYLGVGLYAISGIVFGWLPVLELRRKGGVRDGDSYIHTTRLVDTGIYSIVRHPQYVTFMLWAIAGMLLFQHWLVLLLGIPVFPLSYIDLIKADSDALAKFGDDYAAYMRRVPRANLLLGVLRCLRHKNIGR
jgi:protein-S-isoprenylcysteine O-methyltransferase Ste14